MTTTELMINNWVQSHKNVPVQVLEIMRAMILIDASREPPPSISPITVHVSSLRGLPLTTQILRESKFKVKGDVWYAPGSRALADTGDILLPSEQDFFLYRTDDGLFQVMTGALGNEYQIGKPFAFVHQLQNVYYSLMQEELKITFPSLE